MKIIVSTAPQGTDEWLADRVGIMTGSRIGAVLGHNPHKTRDALMREMVREALGLEREFKGNAATAHGNEHEDTAIKAYEKLTGAFVERCGFMYDKELRIGASVDGIVITANGSKGIEVKCPFRGSVESILANESYRDQVQTELLILNAYEGITTLDFVIWFKDAPITIEQFNLDPEWWPRVKPQVDEFMAEFDAIMADESLQVKYGQPLVPDVSGDEAWQAAEAAFLELDAKIKELKKQQDTHKEVMLKIATAHAGAVKGGKMEVLHYFQKGSVDTKLMAAQGIDVDAFRGIDAEVWKLQQRKSK